jgi:hypothetical protein
MNLVPIKQGLTTIDQLPVDNTLLVTRELMGTREIAADLELPGVLDSPIGTFIEHRGEKYKINTIPNRTKISNYKYQYNAVFEGTPYDLYDRGLRHPTTKNRTFQYYGDLTAYANLIAGNMNLIDSGWTVGDCDAVPDRTLTFTGCTCRAALDIIAEAFEVEWDIVGKEIRFTKQVGSLTTLVFRYGRGQGLYKLGYQHQDDKNIVTRAYGYGGTKNLPEGYRGGASQLMFGGEYLDSNTGIYGIKEPEDYENLEIFPEITGHVSAVSVFDPDAATFTITDTTLNFNLNDYWSTLDPQLSFKSGELQGQNFKIRKFDNATKTITLDVFTDGSDNRLPNSVFQAAIGDTYTLFDMFMPAEVVADAEARLQAATAIWLAENCVPRVLYSLELDPLYCRDNGIYLNPGDKVRIIDDALGIDELIRVVKTTYPFVYPEQIPAGMQIVCEIANFIPYTLAERVISSGIDNKVAIKVVDRVNAERSRVNALNMKMLASRVFDPDGNLAKGTETLYAAMASFGFDSQNFSLVDVTISANAGADANSLLISGGHLVHYFYEVEGLGFDWVMAANSWSGLDPATFYYVYAKCSKTSLVGTWEISEVPVFANEIPGYWAFNLGQLFEVNADGYRDFEFTKGMTYIVGDQITTGRIKSMDGVNYLDLTTGKFNLGDISSGIDWDVSNVDTLTVRGTIIATDASFVNLVVENLRTALPGNKRVEIIASENNIRIYNSSDEVLIEADDDSAVEEITGGTIVYGPGLRVGKLDGDNASISSKGIIATSEDGTSHSDLSKDGFNTTGDLQVEGVGNINDLNVFGVLSTDGNPGITTEKDVRTGGGDFWKMRWENGILIYIENLGP